VSVPHERPLGRAATPVPLFRWVESSLDEAEYLWRCWERDLATHDRDLAGLSRWVEGRLLGSLEGLRLGVESALDTLLRPALDANDPFRATAAAYALATETSAAGYDALMEALRGAPPERLVGLRRAVELAHSELLVFRLERDLEPLSSPIAAALIDAHVFQQRAPNALLAQALVSSDPMLRAAGLRALRFEKGQVGGELANALASSDLEVSDAAMESGLWRGDAEAWAYCLHSSIQPIPRPRSRLLLALLGSEQRQMPLVDALALESTRREALFALGFAGTRQAAEASLFAMNQPELAPLAAEAFCAITGLDLEQHGFTLPVRAAPVEPIPFEEEDLDGHLVPQPDELLPMPDVARVAKWWRQHEREFSSGPRYLRGRTLTLERLQDALHTEPMRRRHAIALELAVRTRGACNVQTRTFTLEQRRQLACLGEVRAGVAASPLVNVFSRVA